MLAADLHRTVIVPIIFLLLCHIVPSLKRFFARRKVKL